MGRRSFFSGDHPVVVAHRGASGTHPENTLEAFSAAFKAGAEAVELDVRLTSDGVAVAFHDPDVSRTTGAEGQIHAMKLADLKRLDASAGLGPRTEVPTLREVLDLASGRGGVMLEMKNIPGEPGFDPTEEGAVEAALEALETFEGPALIASFNPRSIERCRERCRNHSDQIPSGFLATAAMDPAIALRYAKEVGHEWVLPNVTALWSAGQPFVEGAHSAGVRVGTWVVDEARRMETLFSWGVDAIATNLPEVAVPVRDAFRAR